MTDDDSDENLSIAERLDQGADDSGSDVVDGSIFETEEEEEPLILVVEDEEDVAEMYSSMWTRDQYRTRTAYSGKEGLEKLDDEVDVILLDRRMPGMSGDEMLEKVREQGYDVRVAMVTAVEPDFDIVSSEFDDYLVKPVKKDQLQATIDALVDLEDEAEAQLRLRSKQLRKDILEEEKSEPELENSNAYQRLQDDLGSLKDELGEILDRIKVDREAVRRRIKDSDK